MQAVGAGRLTRLPTLYQRTVLFLLVHCIPITAVMMGMPRLLNLTCDDAELSAMVSRFILYVVPGVFIEALSRPLSRILVAQRVAAPLMAISLVSVPINLAVNSLLVVYWDMQVRMHIRRYPYYHWYLKLCFVLLVNSHL